MRVGGESSGDVGCWGTGAQWGDQGQVGRVG
jgi:hypothetical protein